MASLWRRGLLLFLGEMANVGASSYSAGTWASSALPPPPTQQGCALLLRTW
jgi:hypothetical protein